jgi:hypothetical protein
LTKIIFYNNLVEMTDQEMYHELAYYTLSHPDPRFIHQHVVDAFTAQTATPETKSIAIYYALVGLYLFIEKSYTGKEVQMAHIKLSNTPKVFEALGLPDYRGDFSIQDVLKRTAGKERDDAIHKWCVSVWDIYKNQRTLIQEFADRILPY